MGEGAAVPEPDVGGGDFTEFVAGSLPGLLRFGHVLTGSPQEAEDLVQEALAKSLRQWRRVRANRDADQHGHRHARHADPRRPGQPSRREYRDRTGRDDRLRHHQIRQTGRRRDSAPFGWQTPRRTPFSASIRLRTESPPSMAEFGFRRQMLADPDGNELCVVEPPTGRWRA